MAKKNISKQKDDKETLLRRKQGVRDFVKQTGRDKYRVLRAQERAALTDPKTGEIYAKLLSRVKCALCGNDKPETVFTGGGFNFVRCTVCSFMYTNPRLNEEEAEKLYRGQTSIDWWVNVLTSPPQMEYDKKKFAMRLELIERYVPKEKLLDIGCSIGHFLKVAQARGWESHGLELNKKAVAYARKKFKLKNIKEVMLEDAGYPKDHFTAAGLWGVLEHVLYPDRVLKDLHRVLKPDGVVIISVPSAASLAARVLRERTSMFDGIVHLWFYTPETLTKLLEKSGYKIVHMSSEQPEFDVVWNYLNYEDPYMGTAEFPYGPETKKMIEDFILQKNMGYKLITLAQKV